MKKSLKVLSVLLALVLSLSAVCVSAFAAGITPEQAKGIAFADAGVKEDDVINTRVTYDTEDGIFVYEVYFLVQTDVAGARAYLAYDYEIGVDSGKIISKEMHMESIRDPYVPTGDIGMEKAKEIALNCFGLKADEVVFTEAEMEIENGRLVYEIEMRKGAHEEYECKIDAATGIVLSFSEDYDYGDGLFAKILEFFARIKAFFERLFNK